MKNLIILIIFFLFIVPIASEAQNKADSQVSPEYRQKLKIAYDSIIGMDIDSKDSKWAKAETDLSRAKAVASTAEDLHQQLILFCFFRAKKMAALQYELDRQKVVAAPIGPKEDEAVKIAKQNIEYYGQKQLACKVIIQKTLDIPIQYKWNGEGSQELACTETNGPPSSQLSSSGR